MRRRGQALVEFALVAPILMVLLATTLEFGWFYYQVYYLNNAVRLAARTGATQATADNTAITTCVTQAKGPVVLSATPVVTVRDPANLGTNLSSTNRTAGNILTVEARALYLPFTRLVDLRNFGGPTELIVNSSFVIK